MSRPKLRYFECFDYKIIPVDLVSQIDGEEWDIDNWVKYNEIMKYNPNYFIFTLVDAEKENKVVGFMCGVIDEIRRSLFIRGLSADMRYQGNVIPFTRKFMEMLVRKSEGYLKNVYWTTTRPKAYIKHGAFESKNKLLTLYKEN